MIKLRLFIGAALFASTFFVSCSSEVASDKDFINEVIKDQNVTYNDSVHSIKGTLAEILKENKSRVFYHEREDSVMYTDSAGKEKMVSRDKLTGLGSVRLLVADSLYLTDKDTAEIAEHIRKNQTEVWPKGLLPNSRMVTSAFISKIFKDHEDTHFGGWTYLVEKEKIKKIYSFYKPVFFRNNEYCLFRYDYGCGFLCGGGQLAIYKKEKGKWIQWAILTIWTS